MNVMCSAISCSNEVASVTRLGRPPARRRWKLRVDRPGSNVRAGLFRQYQAEAVFELILGVEQFGFTKVSERLATLVATTTRTRSAVQA